MEPTQYRHLPAALRQRFGPEKYDRVKAGIDEILRLGTRPPNLDLMLRIEQDESYPGRDYLRLHLGDGLAAALKHGAALEMFRSIRPPAEDDPTGQKRKAFLDQVERLLKGLELDETRVDRLLKKLRGN